MRVQAICQIETSLHRRSYFVLATRFRVNVHVVIHMFGRSARHFIILCKIITLIYYYYTGLSSWVRIINYRSLCYNIIAFVYHARISIRNHNQVSDRSYVCVYQTMNLQLLVTFILYSWNTIFLLMLKLYMQIMSQNKGRRTTDRGKMELSPLSENLWMNRWDGEEPND